VQVGQDHGFLAANPATHSLTLYISISTPGSAPCLVITATGLSQSQITNMAGRALSS